MKWEDSWMSLLDWSTMEQTFELLSEDKQKLVLEKGYWSLGKGKFEIEIEGSEEGVEEDSENYEGTGYLDEENEDELRKSKHKSIRNQGKFKGRGKEKRREP